VTDPWQTLVEISARCSWGKIPLRTRKRALDHAISHVPLDPEHVRDGASGRAYSPEAVEIITLGLRGRGIQVDGRMATADEREAWERLHGSGG